MIEGRRLNDHEVAGDRAEDDSESDGEVFAGVVAGQLGPREGTVVVSAEEKVAIAGNLEAANEALDRVWELWEEKARGRAWDGRYWDRGDVADLECLIVDALGALEGAGRVLGAVVDAGAAQPQTRDEEPDR